MTVKTRVKELVRNHPTEAVVATAAVSLTTGVVLTARFYGVKVELAKVKAVSEWIDNVYQSGHVPFVLNEAQVKLYMDACDAAGLPK